MGIDLAFQTRVDQALASLETETPALGSLRKVPMDLVAEAVEREIRANGDVVSGATIDLALIVIYERNVR